MKIMNTNEIYIAMDKQYFVIYNGENELKRFLSKKRAFEFYNKTKYKELFK